MTELLTLWLPILISAAVVFVASSLIHMVLGWHRNDYPKVPNEDGLIEALRPLAIPPGGYGFFAAYIASRALPPGASYIRVFQLTGAAAFVGYALALWQMSIWHNRSWRSTILATVDGLIYALLTAGVFGWLWPR